MNQEELMNIMPHRASMLLLDEAELVDGEAHGKKTIKGDEWFLDGHFPGNPVVPGVIQCEILAQTSCLLIAKEQKGGAAFLSGMDKVRFKNPVRPGDTIETKCRVIKSKHPFYWLSGEGTVNGEICVRAEFSVALQQK